MKAKIRPVAPRPQREPDPSLHLQTTSHVTHCSSQTSSKSCDKPGKRAAQHPQAKLPPGKCIAPFISFRPLLKSNLLMSPSQELYPPLELQTHMSHIPTLPNPRTPFQASFF